MLQLARSTVRLRLVITSGQCRNHPAPVADGRLSWHRVRSFHRPAALAACTTRYGAVGAVHPAERPRADMCDRASVCIWHRCATRQVRSAANDKGVTADMEEEVSLTWHYQLAGEVTFSTLIGVRQPADYRLYDTHKHGNHP